MSTKFTNLELRVNEAKNSLINLLTKFFLSNGYPQENLQIQEEEGKSRFNATIITELGSYELAFYFSPLVPSLSLVDNRLEVLCYFINSVSFPILLSRQPTGDFNLELVFEGLKLEIENKMIGTLALYISTTLELEWLRNEAHQLLELTKSSNKIAELEKEKTLNG